MIFLNDFHMAIFAGAVKCLHSNVDMCKNGE